MGLHLENEVAVVKTPTIISNNPLLQNPHRKLSDPTGTAVQYKTSVQRGRLDPRNRLLPMETDHEDLVTSLRVGGHREHQTSCDFFSWECVEENPVSVAMFSVASVTKDALYNTRDESDCRLDVCHVTDGSRFKPV